VRDCCYHLVRILSRSVLWPFIRLHIWQAPGAVEPLNAAVVVANHISHFDPVLLASAFRRAIYWMTTKEFYSNPLLGALLRVLNTIPIDRSRPDHRALRLGVERLRAGRLIGVFPEGGIRAGPTSILGGAAPKSGAGALARIAHAPIIPCVVFGSDRLYAPESWRPRLSRTKIWIAIGAPFSVSDASGSEANARLAEALRQLGTATVAQFSLQPDDLPATPQRRKGIDAQSPD